MMRMSCGLEGLIEHHLTILDRSWDSVATYASSEGNLGPRETTSIRSTGIVGHHTHTERNSSSASHPGYATSPDVSSSMTRVPGAQKLSGSAVAAYRSQSQDHELTGMGAQFDKSSAVQSSPGGVRMEHVAGCPRHDPTLIEASQGHQARQGLGPMDRYLAEGQAERSAILHPHYARGHNQTRECRCTMAMRSHNTDQSSSPK